MFLGQYEELRGWVLKKNDLRALADLGTGAFASRSMDDVISTSLTVIANTSVSRASARALQAAPLVDPTRDAGKPARRNAALLAQVGRYPFSTTAFDVIEARPIVYWWSDEFLASYAAAPKLGDTSPARFGLNSGNNARFVRNIWEIAPADCLSTRTDVPYVPRLEEHWARYMKGSAGIQWIDPCDDICVWFANGLQIKAFAAHLYGSYSRQIRNERFYFGSGVGFSMIGSTFTGRAHRWRAVIDGMAASIYPSSPTEVVCLLNSSSAKYVLQSLNPTVHFQVGDVNRLPVFPVEGATGIFATIDRAFSEHESVRESSVEFRHPGPSPWTYAQAWAQRAVDRRPGEPLPPYEPTFDPGSPEAYVSFALGVALGRFGAQGEGLLDASPPTALPGGILFLSAARENDSLRQPTCDGLHASWSEHGVAIAPDADLRTWLRRDFFDHHKATYDSRPIWWPLSSAKKTFVAWVAIHRWTDATLKELLADHLLPEKRALEGEVEDLRRARNEGDKAARTRAERRYADVKRQLEELEAFVEAVAQCAERGAPPADEKAAARERDATFRMDLNDGVMVNASALWTLLDPQWRDPKKWWKELCAADGRKDCDWSHLAARYFPARVAKKCEEDPSLAVAHGCFWRLHPAKAFAWELRLGVEIRADFTIDEADSDSCRARFFEQETTRALEAVEKELTRRNRKRKGDDDEGDEAPATEMPRTLRIAKGQLWALDPARVLALELRWRAVLGDGFVIEEPGHAEAWSAWVARDPGAALDVVASAVAMLLEARDPKWSRRGFPRDGLVPRLALARTGLWAAAPREVYAFELRMRTTVDTAFVLDEPGAAAARARFGAEQALVVRELGEAHEARLTDEKVKAALPRREDAQRVLALGAEKTVVKAPKKARGKKGVSAASAAATSCSGEEPDA